MLYKREALQVHNSIKMAGGSSQVEVIIPSDVDKMTGLPKGDSQSITLFFVQANYSNEDLSDSSIASGLTKILVSSLDATGQPVANFSKFLKNKKAMVKYASGSKLSIKNVKLTTPDGKTPIAARVFLGG
mgnify:CR=1 FL=1